MGLISGSAPGRAEVIRDIEDVSLAVERQRNIDTRFAQRPDRPVEARHRPDRFADRRAYGIVGPQARPASRSDARQPG